MTEDLYDVRLAATKLEYTNTTTVINQNFMLYKQGLQKQWLEIKSEYIKNTTKLSKLSISDADRIKYKTFLEKNINTKKREFEKSLKEASLKHKKDLDKAEQDHVLACSKLDTDFHWYLAEKKLKVDKSEFNKKVTQFKVYMSRKLSEIAEKFESIKVKEQELLIKETALNIKEEELNKLQQRLNDKAKQNNHHLRSNNSEFDWSSFRKRFNISKKAPRQIYGRLDAISFLGLNQEYSAADLKKAFRDMSKKHHPDTCTCTQEETVEYHVDMFKRTQEAMYILKDYTKANNYK